VPGLFAEESAAGDGDTALREQLEALLRVDEPTVGFMAVALGVAFLAGAAHALTPGHGKAVVAAYLAGSRGTIGDAIYLGTVVTVTHTAGVFALGLIALYASQYLLVDRLLVWMSFASGLLIVAIGGWLFWDRLQTFKGAGGGEAQEHRHWPLGKPHSHAPGHAHSHSHDDDDHSHTHSHSHGEHSHTHAHGELDHSHDDQHEIPKTGRGSLLSLGISGGLVPCPEALAVLLISFTINRLVLGLVILVAFSLGLAAVLIAIGVAMVWAGPALKRMTMDGPWLKVLPVGSAVVVTLLGVVILYRTAVESGML
jgi:nickel/cobalt exporter